jgi:hypothetical protein
MPWPVFSFAISRLRMSMRPWWLAAPHTNCCATFSSYVAMLAQRLPLPSLVRATASSMSV